MDLKKHTQLYFFGLLLIVLFNCDNMNIQKKNIYFCGKKRSFLVEEPLLHSNPGSFPLIIILHGHYESGTFIKNRIGNNQFFCKNGMLTVYPDGSGFIRKNWDDFESEIAYLNTLLDTLFASYPIDVSKCYLAGFSQGGMLAYKMACSFPNRIAAIAMVSSYIDSEYVKNSVYLSRPDSLIAINSMTDNACPFDSFTYKGNWYNSVLGGVLAWKDKNGCDCGPEDTTIQPCATMKRWNNRNGEETVFWITGNGGHAWPGGKGFLFLPHFKPSQCVNASQLILDFFKKHELKKMIDDETGSSLF